MKQANTADVTLDFNTKKDENYRTEMVNTIYNYQTILAYAPSENSYQKHKVS